MKVNVYIASSFFAKYTYNNNNISKQKLFSIEMKILKLSLKPIVFGEANIISEK